MCLHVCVCACVCVYVHVCAHLFYFFSTRLKTSGSQLEYNVGDDKRDSVWSSPPVSVLYPPGLIAKQRFNKRGVWHSHLLSDTQEAQRSQSLGLDEVTAPVGSAGRKETVKINGQETGEQKNQLLS